MQVWGFPGWIQVWNGPPPRNINPMFPVSRKDAAQDRKRQEP